MNPTNSREGSTPVFSLPPELLAQVFLLDKQDEELESMDEPGIARKALLLSREEVFTHVCQHFRSVAIATPSLWTTIQVTCCSTTSTRVEAYCQRSGSAPLDIRVIVCPCQQSQPLLDMIGMVLCHSRRWRKLSVALTRDNTTDCSIVSLLSHGHTPMLELLTLSIDSVDIEDRSIDHDMTPRNVFTRNTTNLKFLRFRGMAVHIFRPPLQQLTVLQIGRAHV